MRCPVANAGVPNYAALCSLPKRVGCTEPEVQKLLKRYGIVCFEGGGVVTYAHAMIPVLKALGAEPVVLAVNWSGATSAFDAETVGVRIGNLHYLLRRAMPAARALATVVRTLECSHAVRRAARVTGLAGLEVPEGFHLPRSLSRSCPTVTVLHGSAFGYRELSGVPPAPGDAAHVRLLAQQLRRSVAVKSPARHYAHYIARKCSFDSGLISVIPHLPPAHVRLSAIAGPPAPSDVVFVGRPDRPKGIFVLLNAWPAVREHCADARLVLVGAGTESVAAKEDTDGSIIGLGSLAYPETLQQIGSAACVVVPSLYEVFGYTALEALCLGKPVVASDAGGLPEVLGDAGVLVAPGDSRALAGAIKRVLSDSGLRARLSRSARERASTAFNPDNLSARHSQFYQDKWARRVP